jgi:O-antigen/teichoic acid export membrane protein
MRGSVIAQGVGLLILPLLTRLYDPAEFGYFQIYQSASLLVVVIVSLRFELALFRAEPGRELNATIALCLLLVIIISTAVGVGWASVKNHWPDIYSNFPVPPLIVFSAVLLVGLYQFLGNLVTREQLYRLSADSKILQSGSYAAVASAFGALRIANGLIVADIIGRVCSSLYLLKVLRSGQIFSIRRVTIADLGKAAWKFREFPTISVLGGMINALGAITIPMLIYTKFNADAAGQFALVERALSFPIAIAVAAVSQVYTAKLSNAIRNDPTDIAKQFRGLIMTLALVAIGPAIIGFLAAPSLFSVLFGPEWEVAGQLAQIMIPALYISFVYGGVNMTLVLLGRQWLQTAWELLRLSLMLVLLLGLLANPETSIQTVVLLYAIVFGSLSLLFILLAGYSIKRGPTRAALGGF